MSRRRASAATPGDSAGFTQTLLARLGLPPDADRTDIEAAHDELVAFLDSAPRGLRPWAQQQLTTAEAAFTLLSGPGIELPLRSPRDAEPDGTEVDDAVLDDAEFDDAEPEAHPDSSDLGDPGEKPADDLDDRDEDLEDLDDDPDEHEEPAAHEDVAEADPDHDDTPAAPGRPSA